MATEMEVIARIAGDASGAVDAFHQASGAAQGFQKEIDKMNAMLVGLGAAIGTAGYAITRFGKNAFDEAARVSELDVAMTAIGRSTGVGAGKLKEAAAAIKAKGIETAAAQKMAIEYAQGELDLADAAKIARVAQDLAVISQKNSTDTALLLTRAIKTGNSQLLKSAGVSRQASEAYEMYATELGKSTTALTASERQQAIVNLIMDEGEKVAGVYEAAMQEAGKVLRSFPRLFNDIQVAIGGALVNGFGPLIMSAYDMVKAFSKAISEGGSLYPVVQALEMVVTELVQPFVNAFDAITHFIKGLKLTEEQVPAIAETMRKLLPVITAVSAGLSAFAGRSLLGNLPVIGRFVGALNPMAIAITTLIALSPRLRSSFTGLMQEAQKLIPPLLKIAKAIAEAAAEFVDEFIIPMATALLNLLGPAINAMSGFLDAFSGSADRARNVTEALKTALVVLTGVYVGLKVVAAAQLAITKAQAIWDGILTVATFVLIAATDGLAAAFAALGVTITATGIGALVIVIGLVIAALVVWYQKSVWFRNMVKQVFEGVVNFFIWVVNKIIEYINIYLGMATKMINGLIGIYNKVAAITGLPKIDPIDPLAIKTIGYLNVGLEETENRVNRLTGAFYKLVNAQKRENQARLDGMGWLDAWNEKAKEQSQGLGDGASKADDLKKKIDDLKQKTLEYVKDGLENARQALKEQQNAMEEYAQSVSSTVRAQLNFGNAMSMVIQKRKEEADEIARQQEALNNYAASISGAVSKVLSLSGVLDDQAKAADALAKAQADVAKAQDDFADAILRGDLEDIVKAQEAFAKATQEANAAQSQQMTFLQRLAKQAESAIGFADRIKKLAAAGLTQAALDQVVQAGAVAGTAIADELLKGGAESITTANKLFADIASVAETVGKKTAATYMSVGEAVGANLMDALVEQSKKAAYFAEKVRELLAAGLSRGAIQEVLDAGVEAGTTIAEELLQGGADRIKQTNELVDQVKSVGDELGKLLANTYYQAGVDLAQSIVAGLESKLHEVEIALAKITTLKGAQAYFDTVSGDVDAAQRPLGTLTPRTITGPQPLEIPSVPIYGFGEDGFLKDFFDFSNIVALASGGIVSKPTLALVGEAGPEAVVPLGRGMNPITGAGDINITVNAGMGANGNEIGQQIVDQLVRWQRRNGKLPVSTV
jgi:hypothetical protein